MGKKKAKSEYNDFLEDTRYRSTNEIRSTLQSSSSLTRTVSPLTDKHPSHQRSSKPKTKNPQLTHFLCLPLVTSSNRAQLNDALTQLHNDVQRLTPVPPKAVRPVGTLHLTLGVMSLSPSQLSDAITHLQGLELGRLLRGITTKKMAEASEASQTLANAIGENGGAVAHPTPPLPASAEAMSGADLDPDLLAVQLRGLVPMQKPSQTSVLYAEPYDKSGRLMRFSESVRKSFEERGWVLEDKRGLKLHATMLNTIYAKDRRAKKERVDKAGGALGAGEGDGEESAGVGKQGINQEKNKAIGEEGVRQDTKSWMRFDAEALMQAYDGFVWTNDVRIDRVQICKMGAKKILHEETGEVIDEQYEVVAESRL
jgi:activating signal cointegrator complex subunit 1